MAVKKEDEKIVNVIDVFWDGWFNSFKTFHSLQNGVEQKPLQALENQKEWIESLRNQFSQIEADSKKLTSEWKASLQDLLNKAQSEFGGQNLTEWTDKFEELGQKAEDLAFSPSKASLEFLSKSHAQLESALKKALDQQQKNRAEVVNAIGGYFEQIKQAQNGVLKSFEAYNPFIAK
jgi:hypothetical protein